MDYSSIKDLIGKIVTVTIDRQLGSFHPKWKFVYSCNYGYIKGIIAPDGEELDAYVLNVDVPKSTFKGVVVAIIHRLNDDDDKLIVIPSNSSISDDEIDTQIQFQEKFFEHKIIR